MTHGFQMQSKRLFAFAATTALALAAVVVLVIASARSSVAPKLSGGAIGEAFYRQCLSYSSSPQSAASRSYCLKSTNKEVSGLSTLPRSAFKPAGTAEYGPAIQYNGRRPEGSGGFESTSNWHGTIGNTQVEVYAGALEAPNGLPTEPAVLVQEGGRVHAYRPKTESRHMLYIVQSRGHGLLLRYSATVGYFRTSKTSGDDISFNAITRTFGQG